MEGSFEYTGRDRRDDSFHGGGDYRSMSSRRSPSHRRSLSDSAARVVTVVRAVPGYLKLDGLGVSWPKRAIINEDFLPRDKTRRQEFAQHLQGLGYGDYEEYKSVQQFLVSLERLVRIEDIDFILESETFNFLIASWIKDGDDVDKQFDFGFATRIRHKILSRRNTLFIGVPGSRMVDEYGRECMTD